MNSIVISLLYPANIYIYYTTPPPITVGSEMSYNKKETKLKKEKKRNKFFLLHPLRSRLLIQVSTHRLDIAVTTHNYVIISRSRVHSLGYAPYTPSHKPPPFFLLA